MEKNLTPKQLKVLSVIKEFVNEKGFSPTLEELKVLLSQRKMKLKSNNSLVQYLKALEEKGKIQRFKKTRGVRLLNEKFESLFSIPLLGNANCGEPLIFADDQIEDYINISKEYIRGNKQDYFFLKAIGDSMDKSGIKNGSLVLIKKNYNEPEIGKDIAVVINGLGTIKRFQKINKKIPVLMPNSNNPKHQPVILHPDDNINICGEVEKVFDFSVMENIVEFF